MEPKRDPREQIERVQRKLSDLAQLLQNISSQARKIADQRRRGLDDFVQATDERAMFDELTPLLENDEKRAKARAILRKPTTIDPDTGVPATRYAQYVEFESADEMLRFKALPPIRPEDVASVDWDDLQRRLQSE